MTKPLQPFKHLVDLDLNHLYPSTPHQMYYQWLSEEEKKRFSALSIDDQYKEVLDVWVGKKELEVAEQLEKDCKSIFNGMLSDLGIPPEVLEIKDPDLKMFNSTLSDMSVEERRSRIQVGDHEYDLKIFNTWLNNQRIVNIVVTPLSQSQQHILNNEFYGLIESLGGLSQVSIAISIPSTFEYPNAIWVDEFDHVLGAWFDDSSVKPSIVTHITPGGRRVMIKDNKAFIDDVRVSSGYKFNGRVRTLDGQIQLGVNLLTIQTDNDIPFTVKDFGFAGGQIMHNLLRDKKMEAMGAFIAVDGSGKPIEKSINSTDLREVFFNAGYYINPTEDLTDKDTLTKLLNELTQTVGEGLWDNHSRCWMGVVDGGLLNINEMYLDQYVQDSPEDDCDLNFYGFKDLTETWAKLPVEECVSKHKTFLTNAFKLTFQDLPLTKQDINDCYYAIFLSGSDGYFVTAEKNGTLLKDNGKWIFTY